VSDLEHILSELQYRLVRLIAEGGMGAVYEAEQLGAGAFRKTVAIKLIHEELSFFEEFQANFIGEARLVADLIHTNIVQTYHLGVIEEQYFMVMEYVDGFSLDAFIEAHRQQNRPIPLEVAVFIASRIARALHYAHQKTDSRGRSLGIVHRDINPNNILIARGGDVKITDFGIAKALDLMNCEEGEAITGKLGYLSPEQVRREVTDHRSDIFAVGLVLAEMLVGHNLYQAETEEDCRRKLLDIPLPRFEIFRPDIDERLYKMLRRSLAARRDDRFTTAGDMLGEFEAYLYSDGYGPTNEKLAVYLQDVFSTPDPEAEREQAAVT